MIEKYLNRKITKVDFEKRMLNGSLKGQYEKLYPRKVQDSITRVLDSVLQAKKVADSIAKAKQKSAKKDTIKLKT